MSSATVYTCDRCSASDTDDTGWALFSLIESEDDPWDLCPACAAIVTGKPFDCGNPGCRACG